MKFCWNTAHSIIHRLRSNLGQRLYGRRSQRNLLAFRKFSDPWFKMVQITSGVLSGRGSDWLPVWVLHALSWSTAEVCTPPSVFSGGAGSVFGLLGALCFWVRGTGPPGQVFLSAAPCGVLLLEAVGLVLFGLLLIWVPLEAFCVFFSFDTSLGPFFFTLWKKLAQSLIFISLENVPNTVLTMEPFSASSGLGVRCYKQLSADSKGSRSSLYNTNTSFPW